MAPIQLRLGEADGSALHSKREPMASCWPAVPTKRELNGEPPAFGLSKGRWLKHVTLLKQLTKTFEDDAFLPFQEHCTKT